MPLRPISAAAFITGRHRTLIHAWLRRGILTAACDTRTREVLVDLTQAVELSRQRQRRTPRILTPAPR